MPTPEQTLLPPFPTAYDKEGKPVVQGRLGKSVPSSFYAMPSYYKRIGMGYEDPLRQIANTNASANPYNTAQADQTRRAQLALLAQMQASPSYSSIASRQALQQGAASALNAGGRSPLQSAMGIQQAGNAMGSALSPLAQNASQEAFGRAQSVGALSSGLRGRDIQSANAAAEAQLRERGANDTMRLRAAQVGQGINNAQQQALRELYKYYRAIEDKKVKDTYDTINTAGRTGAAFAGTVMGM